MLQQEKLQKHTAATWAAASKTKNLNTKGLQLEDEPEDPVKEEDVINWPQCKEQESKYATFYLKFVDEYDYIWKLEKYHEKRKNQDGKKGDGKGRSNRFWSALFPEQERSESRDALNNRKRRIFPDPACNNIHINLI